MVSVATPITCAVQTAQPSDANAMASLAVQLGYPCTEADVQKRLSEMKGDARCGVFVAVSEGKVVGWVGVYIFRAVELDSVAEISGLVVDETIRSRGIGKMLLHAAEDWARCAGLTAISVNSNIVRHRAHRFYESNGYEIIKTQKIFRKGL